MKKWLLITGLIATISISFIYPENNTLADSSCSISDFTMTPSGTVPLGTHVFLEGHSNCGTVKFTVNGTSKAEIGQGNQTETLKTEEFGTGTLEVCFLARGDGGWENANKSCKTLYVQGSQGAPEGSSTNGHCWINSFTASPGRVQVGNTVKLAGYGQCDGNARASKFTIDGKSFNEKGSNTNDASWNTSGYSTGSHKVCFLITSGEWDDGSKSCTTVTLKSDSQEPNAPAQGDPADNRPTAIPSSSSSEGSTSSNTTSSSSCPNHYVIFNVGDYGKVTPGPPNNYRLCAGKSCKKLGEIPGGGEFKVLGGPTCADGYWWWKVSYSGSTGWTAEGNKKTAWLEAELPNEINRKDDTTTQEGKWCSAQPDEAGFFGIDREGHTLPNPRFELRFYGHHNLNNGNGQIISPYYIYFNDKWVGENIAKSDGWKGKGEGNKKDKDKEYWQIGIDSKWYLWKTITNSQVSSAGNWRLDYWRDDGICNIE